MDDDSCACSVSVAATLLVLRRWQGDHYVFWHPFIEQAPSSQQWELALFSQKAYRSPSPLSRSPVISSELALALLGIECRRYKVTRSHRTSLRESERQFVPRLDYPMVSPTSLMDFLLSVFQASNMIFPLQLENVQALNKPLVDDDMVHFYVSTVSLTPDPNGDNTSLNLLSDKQDYLLHISIRRDAHTIVLNSRNATSSWGRNEYIDWAGTFTDGQPTTISIRNNADTFTIFINGENRHLYKKRINLPTQAVAYLKYASMTTAIFGLAVAVQTVGNMCTVSRAPVMFGPHT
jgi:Galactoside-binding lectin